MKTMSTILKTFGAILTTAGVVTLIVSLSRVYDKSTNERQQILEKVGTIENKVDGVNVNIRQLYQAQEDMRTDINSLSNANNNLKNYMMSTAARRGDVKELMDVIKIWEDEKKKSGSVQIPMTQQN